MALLAEIQSECTSKDVNVSRLLRLCLLLAEKLKHAPLKEWATHEYIVQHQLGRAAASGTARFAPYLSLAPILPYCSCMCAQTNKCPATAPAWRSSLTWWPAAKVS